MKVFNLKRCFFVLACSVGSVSAMEFAGGDVIGFSEQLNSQSAVLANQLQHYQDSYPEAENIVVIGAAGAGKSTLITYLANKKLCAREGDSGLYLDTSDSAGDINIGHTCKPGTLDITPFYAADEKMIYWDCPGFGDPRAGEYEIQNAMLIQQLFNSLRNIKIVVVAKEDDLAGRALQFVELLGKLTMFKKEQLESCVSLVITQQLKIRNVDKRLRAIGDVLDRESYAFGLVDYFLSNSERVSTLPYPKDEGDFDDSSRSPILQSLSTTYAEKLMCAVPLSAASREYIRVLALQINTQMAGFIRGNISQAINEAVRSQIVSAISSKGQQGAPTAEQLKESFCGYAARLVSLESTNYVGGLKSLLSELGLFSVLNDPRFNLFSMLTTFGDLLDESLSMPDQWAEALKNTIQELVNLSAVETVDTIKSQGEQYEDGLFILKDTKTERQRRGLKTVDVKKEFWSKKLVANVVSQKITAFTPILILMEPEIRAIREYGETVPRERSGDSWR